MCLAQAGRGEPAQRALQQRGADPASLFARVDGKDRDIADRPFGPAAGQQEAGHAIAAQSDPAEAGIEVVEGVLREEAESIAAGLTSRIRAGRPLTATPRSRRE